PLLYTTSGKFMDYFGLKSMEDMPQLKEFQATAEEIGEPSALEEIIPYEYPENREEPLATPVDESE
ncbi:MAG: SMC-Scp complex subunit ScpB, partial [Bacteroidota bacterium]|nr:SMC-Scp complex subunit ScpB [Bacteroidota bacterium]